MSAFAIIGYLLYMGVVFVVSNVLVWWVSSIRLKKFFKYGLPII